MKQNKTLMIMKKLKFKSLLFALSVLTGMFLAQIAEAKNPENNDKGVLWKIEGNGIQTSYVLGTFHLISKADFNLSEQAISLLKESDKLVLELDMDDPSLQASTMRHAGMKGEATLQSLLSEDEYAAINEKVKEFVGADLSAFSKMKPFVITSMLLPMMFGDEVASYEMALIQIASQQEKEILGLETVEYQMGIFDKIPYEQQAEELFELVSDSEEVLVSFNEMVQHYQKGDINELQKVVKNYYEEDTYVAHLLDNRNENWVDKIGEFSSDQNIFYAVGAGHLGGEKGLINLLRANGYTVTPVE
jgi:hypothetical protein